MLLGKRGEVDNKFLLVVVLIVAVIFLSNNGFFTGRATRYVNPQATGTEDIISLPNVYSTTTQRQPGSIVSQQPTQGGSGTNQYLVSPGVTVVMSPASYPFCSIGCLIRNNKYNYEIVRICSLPGGQYAPGGCTCDVPPGFSAVDVRCIY